MARQKNLVSGLLFFAPIGIVLSAIPQAPDYTAALGWGLAALMLGTALVLTLRSAKAQRNSEASQIGDTQQSTESRPDGKTDRDGAARRDHGTRGDSEGPDPAS